jgi:23S rRNA (cytosine1962-C5)-methyltransferase
MARIILRPGRERPVLQHHPGVFSGAIGAVRGDPGPGDVVDVFAASGEWLARGFWSGSSQIRTRLASWDADQPLDDAWLRAALARAIAGRAAFYTPGSGACRLVFAESDGLPGLIVDAYGPFLVIQLLTQGMAIRREAVVAALADLLTPAGIYERSDADVLEKEGLPPAEGVRWGAPPPDQLPLTAALPADRPRPAMLADLRRGQKTGFYLDQALNRVRVAAYSRHAEVLDAFCYSGGFTLAAAQAGAARITAVDSSRPALDLLRANLALRDNPPPVAVVEGDVFQVLRAYRQEERRFDLIVLDPPKFAHSQAQVDRAARGYKDLNLLACQLLRPGGTLATFSCSGLVSSDLFQKIVFGAALDARRDAQIVERLGHAPDHPVLLSFPEGEYLKGLVCRVW